MKKACKVISGFILISLCLTGLASALEISPADTTGKPGETITVPINISDVGTGLDVDAFSFAVQFNPDMLAFDENDGIDKTGTLVESFSLVSAKIMEPGKVKVSGALFGNPVPVTTDGLFLKINFTPTATGTSQLNLSDFLDDIGTAATTNSALTVQADIIAPPGSLEAKAGIDSVKLTWQPSASAYLAGYNVYRSLSDTGPWTIINTALVTGDYYADNSSLISGVAYYYYLTAADTSGQESSPSDTASAVFGHVKFFIPDTNGKSETQIRIPVNIANADGLEMCSASIDVHYDSSVLYALNVEKTPLSANYGWRKNLNTPGVARAVIATGEGKKLFGEGALFYIQFDVLGNQGDTSEMKFEIDTTYLYVCSDSYSQVPVSLDDTGIFTVAPNYILGDLNGDGIVTTADVSIALNIAVGNIEPSEEQRIAGDVSGDGTILTNDATLITQLAAGLPLTPPVARKSSFRSHSVKVSVPENAVMPVGGTAWIPVEISSAANVSGAFIILNYDPSVISATDIRSTSLSDNCDVHMNTAQAGQVRISLSQRKGNSLPDMSGALVELQFTAHPDAPENSTSPLTLASVHLNDVYGRDFATSVLQTDIAATSGSVTVNGGNTVDTDLSDAVLALKVLAGINADIKDFNADADGNGKVEMQDVLYILQIVASIRY